MYTKNGVTIKPATLSTIEQNIVNTAVSVLQARGHKVLLTARVEGGLNVYLDTDKSYHVIGCRIFPSGRTSADKFEFLAE